MANENSKSLPAIGFLTVVANADVGVCGGYLLLSQHGRPLEFHCTAPRGPQVERILSYEPPEVTPPIHHEGGGGDGDVVDGTVKWFNPSKGFGFVTPDTGGKDVFVHISAVERSGLTTLHEDQRVRLSTSMGQKGPQADTVEII